MNKEVWKEIAGYPDYEISSLGNIRSWKPANQHLPRPTVPRPKALILNEERGYLYCNLIDAGGNRCNVAVHRMVAENFICNIDNLPQVNHKDKNRLNNAVDNLEWCTEEENSIHATGKDISVVSPEGVIVSAPSLRKLSRMTGLDVAALTRLRRGEYKHTKGWVLYGEQDY